LRCDVRRSETDDDHKNWRFSFSLLRLYSGREINTRIYKLSHHIAAFKMNTYFSSFFISIGKTCFTSFLFFPFSQTTRCMWRQKSSQFKNMRKNKKKIPSHKWKCLRTFYMFFNNQSSCLDSTFEEFLKKFLRLTWTQIFVAFHRMNVFQLFSTPLALSNVIQSEA
jgi:hypothetical protein